MMSFVQRFGCRFLSWKIDLDSLITLCKINLPMSTARSSVESTQHNNRCVTELAVQLSGKSFLIRYLKHFYLSHVILFLQVLLEIYYENTFAISINIYVIRNCNRIQNINLLIFCCIARKRYGENDSAVRCEIFVHIRYWFTFTS